MQINKYNLYRVNLVNVDGYVKFFSFNNQNRIESQQQLNNITKTCEVFFLLIFLAKEK